MAGGRYKLGDNKSCAAAELVLYILRDDTKARGGATKDGGAI
jgi:hypothetical protein